MGGSVGVRDRFAKPMRCAGVAEVVCGRREWASRQEGPGPYSTARNADASILSAMTPEERLRAQEALLKRALRPSLATRCG